MFSSSVCSFQGTRKYYIKQNQAQKRYAFFRCLASPKKFASSKLPASKLASLVFANCLGSGFIQIPGSHLLFHAVTSIVPSAAFVLTIVFGMGTGVTRKRITTGENNDINVVDEAATSVLAQRGACSSDDSNDMRK